MQRAVYFRALATLFDSGVPLRQAFELLEGDMVGKELGEASGAIVFQLVRGHSLGQAMAAQKECFSPLQRGVIELGIRTGKLHRVLLQLADYEESRSRLVGRLRSALAYPVLVFLLSMIFVAVVPTMAFDSLFQMLEESDQELSWLTRTVAGGAALLQSPWTYLTVVLGLLGVGHLFRVWYRQPDSPRRLFAVLEALPAVGPVVEAARLAQFSRALSLVTNSGYHLDRGLRVACRAAGSPLLEARAKHLVAELREGETLAQTLRGSGLFPDLYWQSISAGEESGEMSRMLDLLAHIYESEVEYKLARFASLLEPLTLLGLGIIVGVLVVACIQPLAASLANL